ncbi:MAG: HNH endonuclease [Endomicrobiaceae bacterium]|nr:HNH endonuclease [Endomicrobiaceae bacterium]
MRNINRYTQNCFEFHSRVLSRKRDINLKNRINAINHIIEGHFNEYDNNVINANLHLLRPYLFSDEQKTDLQSLYDYNAKIFRELKQQLSTMDDGTIQPLCPYCTVNNSNTFDHFVPQEEFAEFSDNPINLIPCCSYCNGKKLNQWRNYTFGTWLNLYFDILPNVEYLFTNLSLQDSINVEFYIDNPNNIHPSLFLKIQNHYQKLDLCRLFKENSYNVISELQISLKNFSSSLNSEKIKNITIQNAQDERNRFGYNYWKSVLKIACCENIQIFNFLLS